MKRPVEADDDVIPIDDDKKVKKKKKMKSEEESTEGTERSLLVLMDENLLFEVLKHVDARTLATAACVSKQWHRTVEDERLWELICTRHWANIGCGNQQLRSVVLALGGFRRLHSLYLWPLSKPSSSSSSPSTSSTWPCLPPPPPPHPVVPTKSTSSTVKTRWGKDEQHRLVQVCKENLKVQWRPLTDISKDVNIGTIGTVRSEDHVCVLGYWRNRIPVHGFTGACF